MCSSCSWGGRILLPAYSSRSLLYDNGLLSRCFALLSTDGGETWRRVPTAGNGPPLGGRWCNENHGETIVPFLKQHH